MADHEAEYYCRVCGLYQGFPIWGDDGQTPSWTICECCGTEFGYEDIAPATAREARQIWLAQGAKWFKPRKKPQHWNLDEQLANVPAEYR